MNSLPLEVIRIISLMLKVLTLSINKSYYEIYNDDWYYDYLISLYPDVNLWKQTTYKDLYIKSLSTFNIKCTDYINMLGCYKPSLYFHKFPIKCIEAYRTKNYKQLMLTFNGELYLDNNLLDINVVTINSCSYATNVKWFMIDIHHNVMEIMSLTDIIKVGSCGKYLYAITKNTIYIYNSLGNKNFSLDFNDIKDVYCFNNDIFVLENNGNLYLLQFYGDLSLFFKKNIHKFYGDYISYADKKLCFNKMLKINNHIVELIDGNVHVDNDFVLEHDVKDIYKCDSFLYIKEN